MKKKLLLPLAMLIAVFSTTHAQQLIPQVAELQPGFNYKKHYFQTCPSCTGQCNSLTGGIYSIVPYKDKLYFTMGPFANANGRGTTAIARYAVSGQYNVLSHLNEDISPRLFHHNSHIIFSSADYQTDSASFYRMNVKTESLEMLPARFLNAPHTYITTVDDNAIAVPYLSGRFVDRALSKLDHSTDMGNTFTTVLTDQQTNILNNCICSSGTVQPDTVSLYAPTRFKGGYFSLLGQMVRNQATTQVPHARCYFYFQGSYFTAFNNNFPQQSSWKNIAALNEKSVTFAGVTADYFQLFGMENGALRKIYLVQDSTQVTTYNLPCIARGLAGVTDAAGYFYFVSDGLILYRTLNFQQWEQFLDLGEYVSDINLLTYWPQQNAILFTEKDGRWRIFRINLATRAQGLQESFESDQSPWTTHGTKDFLPRTGPSRNRSNNTGPLAASAGNFYMYVNSKSGSNSPLGGGQEELSTVKDTAYLLSPALDLTAIGSNSTLSFKYHMYGGSVGTLRVQVSTDGGNSFQNLWSVTGNQGDQWKNGSVSLASYITYSNTRIRFAAEVFANTSSDIAVDNIQLGNSIGGGMLTYR